MATPLLAGMLIEGGLNLLVRRFFQITERAAALVILKQTLIPKLQKMTLEDFIKEIVPDPVQSAQLLQTIKNARGYQAAVRFFEYIKKFNFEYLDAWLKTFALSSDAATMVARTYNAIYWSFGFGWLSWVSLSPILSFLISTPLNQDLRRELRQKEITDSKIERLFIAGLISEEEFKRIMLERGYPERQIELWIQYLKEEKMTKDKDLTKSEILRLYRYDVISRQLAKDLLMSLGYDEEESELLLDLEDIRKLPKGVKHE